MVAREEGHNSSSFQHNVSPQPVPPHPSGFLSKIRASLYTQDDPTKGSSGSSGSNGSKDATNKVPGGNRGEVVGGVA